METKQLQNKAMQMRTNILSKKSNKVFTSNTFPMKYISTISQMTHDTCERISFQGWLKTYYLFMSKLSAIYSEDQVNL